MLRHLDKKRFSVCACTYYRASESFIEGLRSCGVEYALVNGRSPFEPWSAGLVIRARNRWLKKMFLALSWAYYLTVAQGTLVLKLAGLLRKKQIDVVMLNNDLHMHAAGVIAAKLARKPVIVRKAGGINEGQRIKKLLTKWVDAFVVVSEATRADQMKSADTKRIVVIPEAVEVERFGAIANKNEARAILGLPTGAVVIGSASRLVEGKGHVELLHAAQRVVKECPEIVFYLAGDEDPADVHQHMREKLEKLSEELGLKDRVLFPGWRRDTENVLAAIDVFVHCPTSFIEGFCIANLEAMAAGKPTIVTRNGGLPDAVVDGVTGYIVEPGDIQGLAEAILDLSRNPEKSREMGERARKRVIEKFEIGKMMKAYEELIEEYCQAK
jgi:glycosyltransferase involved in cell wall biosynthesis